MIGKKFNRLTVIKYLRQRSRHSLWLCKCDCGNECEKSGPHLKNGHTTSCGCQKREKTLERNKKPWNHESRLRASLAKLGLRNDKTNHWKGGKSPLPIRMRTSPEYNDLRRKTYERDGFKCVKCEEKDIRKLNIHHIIPWVDDASLWFEPSNVLTLCKECHKKEHKTWPENHSNRKRDEEEVLRLRKEGKFFEEIAEIVNSNRNRVSRICKKNGIK